MHITSISAGEREIRFSLSAPVRDRKIRVSLFPAAVGEEGEICSVTLTVNGDFFTLSRHLSGRDGLTFRYVVTEETGEAEGKKYVAIQATTVGMDPDVNSVVIDRDEFYKKLSVAYDLIYRPGETLFMKLARKNGVKACNGVGMLVYQGIISFELWNDIPVSDEEAEILCKLITEALGV